MPGLDLELVRHALAVARRHGYVELELETPDGSFSAVLEPKQRPANATALESPLAVVEDRPGLRVVKAPMVGFARNPAQPAEVGGKVEPAEVIAVISALGMENDVESGLEGEVVEVHFQDGDPVQFGQALVSIQVNS